MTLSNALTLLLCLLITSCGEEIRSRSTKEIEIPITEAEVFALKSYQSFECASLNGDICPEGIGRIMVLNYRNKRKSRFCSGFLTSENTFITNNHCLSTQKECDDSHISVFNGTNAVVVGCKRIIASKVDHSDTDYRGQDFTIIELQKSLNITPFRLSPLSASLGDSLTAWVVDQMGAYKGRITQLACTFSKQSYSMVLSNCPAIPGNSGSPVVNSQNEIIGILWGGSDRNKLDESDSLEERRGTYETANITDVKFFRNYIE